LRLLSRSPGRRSLEAKGRAEIRVFEPREWEGVEGG